MALPYEVLSIMQTIGPGAGNESVDYVRATFQLTDGSATGDVAVPLTDGWETALTAAIEARVAGWLRVMGR